VQIIAILIGLVLLAAIAFYVSRPLLTQRRAAADMTTIATLEIQRDAVYAQIRELDMDHATGKTNDEDYQRIRAELVAQAAGILKKIDTVSSQPFVDMPELNAPMTSPASADAAKDDVEAIIAARRKARSAPAAKSVATKPAADDVEAAIAKRRKVQTAPEAKSDQDIEALITARRKPSIVAENGQIEGDVVGRDKNLEPAATGFCHKCGKPFTADDVFCSKCGAALKKQPVA